MATEKHTSGDGADRIPSGLPRCKACGDVILPNNTHCTVCHNELVYGIIPKLKPGKPIGTGNTAPAKHDSDYHGGRFHEGEW